MTDDRAEVNPELINTKIILMSYPALIQNMILSAEKQGAYVLDVIYDPDGGQANHGWASIAVKKDGVVFINSGSLLRSGGELGWMMRMSNSMPLAEYEAMKTKPPQE